MNCMGDDMMQQYQIEKKIPSDVKTVLILGHIRPDGDSVGSCLGLYHYLKDNVPSLEIEICLQKFADSFNMLPGAENVCRMEAMDMNRKFDLCISCDASDRERLGEAVVLFDRAEHTICIDHHITNPGFGDWNYVRGELSSCAETLGELFTPAKISTDCAKCLYLGIVHDTGVFKYSNTTLQTMAFAGLLIEKGINHTQIIDRTYFARTAAQTRICGRAMSRMKTADHGRITYSVVTLADMRECGAGITDLNGIVEQLRIVEHAETAVFIYELEPGCYKVSLRSNNVVDVSKIASSYGGGGHEKAAGFDIHMSCDSLIEQLLKAIKEELPAV
ncbi:MAG: bifunctional oligoribonuclease/PAP phosphatase NrnA [Lachnospiraceae bacterium]|nr:bifunctional oligoribonuclease/PAP phosphatase NrnA [Lachnospiraceae bacterium]